MGDEPSALHTCGVLAVWLLSVAGEQRAEEVMMTVGEQLIEQGRQKGILEARAEDIVRILTVRGVHVEDTARQRILTCRDPALLDRWLERALTASTVADVTVEG